MNPCLTTMILISMAGRLLGRLHMHKLRLKLRPKGKTFIKSSVLWKASPMTTRRQRFKIPTFHPPRNLLLLRQQISMIVPCKKRNPLQKGTKTKFRMLRSIPCLHIRPRWQKPLTRQRHLVNSNGAHRQGGMVIRILATLLITMTVTMVRPTTGMMVLTLDTRIWTILNWTTMLSLRKPMQAPSQMTRMGGTVKSLASIQPPRTSIMVEATAHPQVLETINILVEASLARKE